MACEAYQAEYHKPSLHKQSNCSVVREGQHGQSDLPLFHTGSCICAVPLQWRLQHIWQNKEVQVRSNWLAALAPLQQVSVLLFQLISPWVAGVILEADADLSTVQLLWAAVSSTNDRHSGDAVNTHQVQSPPGVVLLWDWGTVFFCRIRITVIINGHTWTSCIRSWFCRLRSYSSGCHISWGECHEES